MADYTANLDGNLTLEQTKDLCEAQQNHGFRLQSIENATIPGGGQALMVNKTEFMNEPFDWLRTLLFLDLGADDPKRVKQQKEGEGWTWVCNGRIYVENNIKSVMVVGK